MKWDVKSILTIIFSFTLCSLTAVLVIHAIVRPDMQNLPALVDKLTTAFISAVSLALGYFFGRTRQKEIENDTTDEETHDNK